MYHSYGIIPIQKTPHGYLFLVVHNIHGHWEFPKGTPDEGETPEQTALREFQEESGVNHVRVIPNLKLREEYLMPLPDGTKVPKEVFFFVGVVEYPKRVNGFHGDVDNALWLSFNEALAQLTFPEARAVLQQVKQYLDEHPI